jgi:acetyl esterase/lipase
VTVALDEAALAESRAFNEQLARLLAEQTSVHLLPPEVTRRVRREGRAIWPAPVFLPQARDVTIPTRGGEIRLRVLAPEAGCAGVYVHFHGGGWVLGECDEQDPRLWALVQGTGLCAVSVGYRLAPEHPYPAGLDDCEDATVWLLEGGLDELGLPDRLTIAGESAGANLAVATLVRLRDRHGATGAFCAANLVYGGYDLAKRRSERDQDSNLILTPAVRHWFRTCYAGDRSLEELRDPDISPLYADVRDLPPALFTVGELDPLLDDSIAMAARWEAAGNEAELKVWPESVHGFNLFPLALARAANEAQHEFLRNAVS